MVNGMNLNTNTTVDIAFILAIGSFLIASINVWNSSKRNHDNEIKRQLDIEKNFVKINTKFDHFVSSIERMMNENQRTTDDLRRLTEQLIKNSENIDTLFKYKDNHETRISTLEDKVK